MSIIETSDKRLKKYFERLSKFNEDAKNKAKGDETKEAIFYGLRYNER